MLVSFIIPVYNVERYLPICIDSILTQGLAIDDFEIILIEDRSTDGSLQICRYYESKYKNITLIENEQNLGPGLSRNKGMKISQGEYLHFVDSDDYLFPNSLHELLSLNIISKSPDIIRFASSDKTDCLRTQKKILYEGKYDDSHAISPCLCAWRYWFRHRYLIENNIGFGNKISGEDAIFTFSALIKNPSIIVSSSIVYFYRHHNESITSGVNIRYVNCLFEVADEIKKISSNHYLTTLYISEVYKDIINHFYKSRRTVHECIEFKKKLSTIEQYEIITKGRWYLQLSRIPLLLFLYLLIKK